MTTTTSQIHETADARRRQLRMMQLIFAGAAAIAMLALFDAARPDTTETVLGSGSVRLTDMAVPAPASGPFGPQFPQSPPSVVGGGGFAADDDDDQAQQQAQQQEQLALQEMQQAEQQAEQQNEQAEQQFEEGMQQAQMDEQQANNP
jgi:hypothetical protein